MSNNWKKNLLLFLTSQALSLFGSMLVQYAITWYIALKAQSGIMMTISIICGFLPTFFISPFAGVWADRFNRKILIMLSDSIIAFSTLILAVMFLLGYDKFWMIFVVSGIRALGAGVQTPAVGAFLPQIVPEDQLTRVNAINSTILAVIMLISPMLSGALLSVSSIEIIFFIDVGTAVLAVLTLLIFLRVPAHKRALEIKTSSYFSDMKMGYNYIKNHAFVRSFFIMCAFFFVLVSPVAFLTPLQVARSFGDDVWRLTATEVSFSVGMMFGGIIIASWGGFKNRAHTIILAFLISGACTFSLGIVPNFWIYLLFMCLNGLVMPLFNTPITVLLQEKVEGDYLGRVFGVLSMIQSVVMPLGMLLFGPLADIIKIEWLLIATGFLIFSMSFFIMRSKVFIEAGKPKLNTFSL